MPGRIWTAYGIVWKFGILLSKLHDDPMDFPIFFGRGHTTSWFMLAFQIDSNFRVVNLGTLTNSIHLKCRFASLQMPLLGYRRFVTVLSFHLPRHALFKCPVPRASSYGDATVSWHMAFLVANTSSESELGWLPQSGYLEVQYKDHRYDIFIITNDGFLGCSVFPFRYGYFGYTQKVWYSPLKMDGWKTSLSFWEGNFLGANCWTSALYL